MTIRNAHGSHQPEHEELSGSNSDWKMLHATGETRNSTKPLVLQSIAQNLVLIKRQYSSRINHWKTVAYVSSR